MRIVKHLPNTITSLNLFFGTLAVIYGFQGHTDTAVILVLVAAVCDFLDGFVARILKAYSPMGKELDSLADLVSFGLAPTILLFNRYEAVYGVTLLTFVPVAVTIASALRLAKFNVDTRQTESFIGVPTPANAILICMLLHYSFYNSLFDPILNTPWFIPVFSIIMSFLLVCNIPMFSLKFKSLKWRGNELKFGLIIFAIVLSIASFIIGTTWSASILAIFVLYILINVTEYILTLFRKR